MARHRPVSPTLKEENQFLTKFMSGMRIGRSPQELLKELREQYSPEIVSRCMQRLRDMVNPWSENGFDSFGESAPELFEQAGALPTLEQQFANQGVSNLANRESAATASSQELPAQTDLGNPNSQVPNASNVSESELPSDAPVDDSPQNISNEDKDIADMRELIKTGAMSDRLYANAGFSFHDKPEAESMLIYEKAGGKIVTDEDVVNGIIKGEYGNGQKRKDELSWIGMTDEEIHHVQGIVNNLMHSARKPSKSAPKKAATPERSLAENMVSSVSPTAVTSKNTGYAQPPLNHATDAIWDRVRQKGLVSPEQAIRSGLFTPDEVRYINENDLWRYR